MRAEGSVPRRLFSWAGLTSVAQYFVMDWAAVWKDIVGGLLIAGAFVAWVPTSWLQVFFLNDHPVAAKIWGPLIGPPWWRWSASSAPSGTSHRPRCYGTAGSASVASCRSSSPP